MTDHIDADRLTTSEPVARLESLAEFLDHQIEEAAAMQKASFDRRCVDGDKQGLRWHARQCALYEVKLKLKALEKVAPSPGVRSALDKMADKIAAKIVQLEHYRDNDCQLDHAKTIAEGRVIQANQILHWIAEAALAHPAPQDEMRSCPSEPLQCLRYGTVDAFGPVSKEKK